MGLKTEKLWSLDLTYITARSHFCACMLSCSVVSDSFPPYGLQWPGSSVHGISQARRLEWVAISYSRDLPNPGIKPVSPELGGGFFTTEPLGKPHYCAIITERSLFIINNTSKPGTLVEPLLPGSQCIHPHSWVSPSLPHSWGSKGSQKVRPFLGLS